MAEDSQGSEQPARPDASTAPEVAVVVPVGRVDDLLDNQLHAVLAQVTSFPFEVVVSCNDPNGVSRLAVARVVKQFGDPRLRAVWSGDLPSAAHARNVGARSTASPVVAFCDADDEVAPGWLEAIVRRVRDGVAVGGHLDEERFAVASHDGWRPLATPGELPSFLGVDYVVSANMAVTRADFEAAGGFDTTLLRCEDIALSWELRRIGVDLVYAPDAIVHYRHRESLRSFVLQHYRYGRGMAQVLARHPMPGTGRDAGEAAFGIEMLRPNRQVAGAHGFVGVVVRRVSLAAGRTVGLADERLRHHQYHPKGRSRPLARAGSAPPEPASTQNGAR